jgi:hypothetical protein
MRKIVTMHQPNYLPWIGLFSKIHLADCFIISDSYQCADITRRNKIRTNAGSGYLTIPIGKKFYKSRICDVLLPDEITWQDLHWQQIYQNYAHTKYFGDYGDFFKTLYKKDYKYLWQINIEIILFLLRCFDINVEILKTTDLNLDPQLEGTDLILAELKSVGGQIYLSGPSGSNYLEFKKFPNNDVDLKFFRFEHPVYKQRYPGFIPNLSAIDLLFNMGTMSGEIIRKSGFIEEECRNM